VFVGSAVDPNSVRGRAERAQHAMQQAEQLLVAGDASAALALARTVDEQQPRIDRRALLWLRARAAFPIGLAADATADLTTLLTLPGTQPAPDDVRRLLAQAQHQQGHDDACADAFAAMTPNTVLDDDAVLWATCLRSTAERAGLAHDALAGRTSEAVRRLRVQLLLDDGLPRNARDDVAALLEVLSNDELLALSARFAAADDDVFADALLDVVLARTATSGSIAGATATRGRSGWRRVAAVVDDVGAGAAADGLRDGGDAAGAWRVQLALGGPQRLRQRAALLVEQQQWARVWALLPRLRGASLLNDADIAYAVAFAGVSTGHLDEAERVLDDITDAAAFARTTELRAAIARCRAKHQNQEQLCAL
jgi:hypothetical protein